MLGHAYYKKYLFALIASLVLTSLGGNYLIARPSKISPLANMELELLATLPDFVTDLSGITYHAEENRLYAISNMPPEIFQLDMQGNILRRIKLSGFEDTEDIAHLGNENFTVVDERRREVVWITIKENTNRINYKDCRKRSLDTSKFSHELQKNRGLEAITIQNENLIMVGHESNPVKIGTLEEHPSNNIHFALTNEFSPSVKDVSAIHYWKNSNQFLVLSEASHKILAINKTTDTIDQYPLSYDTTGFWPRIQQPEGITSDNKNHIYIAAEPNLLYRLKQINPQ